MAQIKLLKIGSDGVPLEMDTAADDITLNSYTVNGGLVASSTGIDMNDTAISDASGVAFNDPSADGITTSAGLLIADKILGEGFENSMDVGSAILFPVVTDDADELDALRIPAIAGVPSATPSDGGEGYIVWDSSGNNLYAWDGAAWDNLSTVSQANSIDDSYTGGEVAGISLGEAVYISAANTVSLADNDAAGKRKPIGLATEAIAQSAVGNVRKVGVLAGLSGLTAGDRYYLDSTAGALTNTLPSGSGEAIIQMGYAKSTTEFDIQDAEHNNYWAGIKPAYF